MPACLGAMLGLFLASAASAGTVSVTVVDETGTPLADGVRWLLEEDTTYDIDPDNPPAVPTDSAVFQLHKSYMPIAQDGTEPTSTFDIANVDETKRYYLTILPHLSDSLCGSGGTEAGGVDGCYTMSGAPVRFPVGSATTSVRVKLTPQPLPPAQARVLVFDDSGTINNAWDPTEPGIGDVTVFIYDAGGGPLVTDVQGNPLGTRYDPVTGDVMPGGLGDGTLRTMNSDEVNDPSKNPYGLKVGEVLIQNLPPGKYGIRVVPPFGQGWHQTTTIEGTPGIDIWITAGEPMFAVEFGPTFTHAFFGLVKEFNDIPAGSSTISGTVVNLRMARPGSAGITFSNGEELGNCWIGLNDLTTSQGLYVAPCNRYGEGEASFEIRNVPDGTYQVVVWDEYLLNIISFFTAIVDGGNVALNEVPVPRWFANHEHYVFNDTNGNGIRDDEEAEPGLPEQAVNLRYRDGSIYFASATDLDGYLPIEEVFPFFSFLVAEVDFARFKATGTRLTIDDGGPVTGNPDDVLDPGNGLRNPQIQPGGQPQRVETIDQCGGAPDCEDVGAPPLLEAYNSFAGTNHKFEWGKKEYGPGENGGISGVVYYQVTQAENDPRYAAPEPWEPGIPRVPVFAYRSTPAGVILDNNSNGTIELADIDYYPFGWSEGGAMGPEDVERSTATGAGNFDLGDAVVAAATDSWDDNLPDGCVGDTLAAENGGPYAALNGRCYDSLRNWSQVRPAVFDGGFGLGAPWDDTPLAPGPYVVEAAAPAGYEHQNELSKNVDFGDTFVTQALPPVCVGDPSHTGGNQAANFVPSGSELSLFGGVPVDERYTGNRPWCSFKLVLVADAKNTAVDFFMYPENGVQAAGHIQGNVTNDLGNSINPMSPNFGEKLPGANIPISIRDYAGNEINRLYTDFEGRYNGLVASTYRINAPMPTGVSPNMARVCLNPAYMTDPADPDALVPDPHHDPRYSQTCYTLNFSPATTTYLDTPVLPVGAFIGTQDWQVDCNYPSGTPVISYANADSASGGPVVSSTSATTLTIYSIGTVEVPNPSLPHPAVEMRDFGFGPSQGSGAVTIGGTSVAVNSWSDAAIEVTVPAGVAGQLAIVRDNGRRTVHGLSISSVADFSTVNVAGAAGIQAAIDAADPGEIVLVPPGNYTETLFMTKPIRLQGYGPGAVLINASRSADPDNLIRWREEANRRVNCPASPADEIGLLPGQPNNVVSAADPAGCNNYVPDTGLLVNEENAGVLVAPVPGVFGAAAARIDGFTFTGSDYAAGILVNGYAIGLEISNNILANNQGNSAAGIRVGAATLLDNLGELVNAGNTGVTIHHNYVSNNSSTVDNGGGIGLYNGSDGYQVRSNYICGNFTQGDGAGIAHFGRSPNGVIADNSILFNQAFDQTAQGTGGYAGGILIAGHQQAVDAPIQVTAGSGPVKITGNRIQGNLAGSGDGAAIMLRSVNGQDLLVAIPETRDSVRILNNFITNNVTALAGAITLQDAVNVSIVNNTIAYNDSSATAAAAFVGAPDQSDPQPAGIVSRAHSAALLDLGIGGIGNFSEAVVNNNIVFANRSMHWTDTVGGGQISVDGFHDLAVLGAGGTLNTSANILTAGGVGVGAYSTGNRIVAIGAANDLFVTPYFNGDSPNGAAHVQTTPLLANAAQDEGGNFLNVTFGPLELQGDYHVETGSTAVDTGTVAGMLGFPELFADIDGDPRPVYGATALQPDIGADEVAAHPNPPEVAPRIISAPSPLVQQGTQYAYQVVAVDPNQVGGFTYQLQRCNNPFSNCNQNVNQFGPASISGTGLFTWTPSNGGARNWRIRVCDATARCDTQDFRLDPYTSNPPIANDNLYDVDVVGRFVVTAPGVLGNDSAGNGGNNNVETLTASLVSQPGSGSVVLGPNGAVFFTPVSNAWVGTTSFVYRISDGVHPSMPTATVTMRRRISVTSAVFTDNAGTANDSWAISGTAMPMNGYLSADLVPANGGAPIFIGRTPGNNDLADGNWAITGTGVSMTAGDTIRIRRNNTANVWLQQVVPSILYGGQGSMGTTAFVQCPGDDNGDGVFDAAEKALHPEYWCRHLTAGDGFIQMAEGTAATAEDPAARKEIYTFGFSNASDVPVTSAIAEGLLDANFPAPTLVFEQGHEAYLSLTNVGTILRPDLFDPHTVHFHGFPNASAVFDGVPESSISINAGFTLTYYYNVVDPGTFMYHCHVEAAEHMQMGMLGNLYVRPAQDGQTIGGFDTFVYNDGDGSTGYDVELAIQIGSMDSNFHDEHLAVQPLPFAEMHDDYPMLNGRGYPDTINTGVLPAAASKIDSGVNSANESSQKVHSTVEVAKGERLLLRISNLNVTQFSTLATSGLPMQVVGQGAHILRGPGDAQELYYETNSVTLGGGEAVDVLIDTSDVQAGTYFLYSTNLDQLSNGAQDFGGMMTEIRVTD